MIIKKHLAAWLAAAVGLLFLTGCSHSQTPQLANEITLSLDNVTDITIAYDEEEITFYESETDELVIKEYMTANESTYYARVKQSGDSVKISEGGKPLFRNGFSRYIEVYLPASYHEKLTVTTTNGNINASGIEMSLDELRIDSTVGTVLLGAVKARNIHLSTTSGVIDADSLDGDKIKIDTTRGSFFCDELDGSMSYATTRGNADIKSACGSGSYKASNSGELNVVYTEVTGDLTFFNKNDNINITLPSDLEFEFEATTKNGSVTTNFQESVTVKGRTTSGTVGGNPTVTVKVETNNGNIDVKQ